jgi:glycosyltransferase involved in cell wall biosynthesis
MLAVVETHPIQYHAPVYRYVQQELDVPVTVVYGSDFSVAGYRDEEFGARFAWDTDLLSGYRSLFLARIADGGGRSLREVSAGNVRQALKVIGPRAVLLVGYTPSFHVRAWFEALREGYPLLFRAETADHAVRRSTPKRWLRDGVLRWLYARCHGLLYVGRRSYEHFVRLGCPDSKLVFSPYCVDTTAFELGEEARSRLRPVARTRLGVRDDQVVLLLSGKLVRRKRPDLVLRAIKMLPPDLRSRTQVVVLGAGDEQRAFDDLAREEPRVAVACLGFQNQTQLSAYYHAADALVLASESNETWGLVVNEALHHGVPCVVSDAVGSAPDLVQPGLSGEVFPSGSAEELAAALIRAQLLMGRLEVRERCARIVSSYSVARAAEGLAAAYQAAVGHGGPGMGRGMGSGMGRAPLVGA